MASPVEYEQQSVGDRTGMQLVSVQRYESGPPASFLLQQKDAVDAIAVEKSEEWIKKRRVEQTTTKQVETRVKRQVLVDHDGNVIEDSGPQVTTNTTREDTETKEENHTEKKGGDENELALPEGWVAIPGATIVREKHQKKYNTRDEIDERLETEERHRLGDVTNEELDAAIANPAGLEALTWKRPSSIGSSEEHQKNTFALSPNEKQIAPASTKRIIHQSRKHKRFIDQEDIKENSTEVDGRVTTETTKHEHHEEIDDDEQPDEGQHSDTSSIHEITKETKKNYTHVKDEDEVEYIAVPRGAKISDGIKLGHGPRKTSETIQHEGGEPIRTQAAEKEGKSVESRPSAVDVAANASVPHQNGRSNPKVVRVSSGSQLKRQPSPERTDALTKKPLDFEQEEETRKFETSRWLESHFGSESSHSSHGGDKENPAESTRESDQGIMPSQISSGGINVTMVSKSPTSSARGYDETERYEPLTTTVPGAPITHSSRIYRTSSRSAPSIRSIKPQSPERVQVLPIGPDKIFLKHRQSMPVSPPQSPIYKTTSKSSSSPPHSPTYRGVVSPAPPKSTPNHQSVVESPPQSTTHYSSTPRLSPIFKPTNISNGYPSPPSQDVSVKRGASFNHASKPYYPPLSREAVEAHERSLSSRQSFLASMSKADHYSVQKQPVDEVTYTSPIAKRWPPPPRPVDVDNHVEAAEPVRATVIRVGPSVNQVPYHPAPIKPFLNPERDVKRTISAPVNRSQSMMSSASRPYPVVAHYPSHVQPVNRHVETAQRATSNTIQMNQLNTSQRRSVHEDLVPERGEKTYYIDIHRSFPSCKENSVTGSTRIIKTSHERSDAKSEAISVRSSAPKSPPPRPAPPSNYSMTSSLHPDSLRASKSSLVFADHDDANPPVRPVRRKNSKLRSKTDSGTQTINRTETVHTADQSKPIKKYYMGQDPYTGRQTVQVSQSVPITFVNGTSSLRSKENIICEEKAFKSPRPTPVEQPTPNRNVEIVRSQTMPRRPKPIEITPVMNPILTPVHARPRPRIETQHKNQHIRYTNQDQSSTVVHTPLPATKPATSSMNRSQSFNVQNVTPVRSLNPIMKTAAAQALTETIHSNMNSTSIIQNPMYKSTPYLNHVHTKRIDRDLSPLKSPGIISTISKSQLDLSKNVVDELHSFKQFNRNESLYTLPRKRPEKKAPVEAAAVRCEAPPAPAQPVPDPVSVPIIKSSPLPTPIVKSPVSTTISSPAAAPVAQSPVLAAVASPIPTVVVTAPTPPVIVAAPTPLAVVTAPTPAVAVKTVAANTQRTNSIPQPVSAPERSTSSVPAPAAIIEGERETLSSIHRRKMAAKYAEPVDIMAAVTIPAPKAAVVAAPPVAPEESASDLTYQSSSKAVHRNFHASSESKPVSPSLAEINREVPAKVTNLPAAASATVDEDADAPENKSLKDRIALLESAGIHAHANVSPPPSSSSLPRVVSSKFKAGNPKTVPAPPPQPSPSAVVVCADSADVEALTADQEDPIKKNLFLKGLLNAAPELFMHIHGDENLETIKVKSEIAEARHPSPPTSIPTENRSNLSRVYASTPALNQASSSKHSTASERNEHSSLQPLLSNLRQSSLLRSNEHLAASPSGSLYDLTVVRRGSLNSNNGTVISAVKIPPPVDYSETVRMKSSSDPDSTSHVESDSVQTFSKKTIPYEDGFSSETMQSSEKTTVTRSEYMTVDDSHPTESDPPQIRTQESGGVVIQVRGADEETTA